MGAGANASAGVDAGVGVGGGEAARGRVPDDLTEDEAVRPSYRPPLHMVLIEKPTGVRTNLGFDCQIGCEGAHGRMGIGVWGAGNCAGIVREVLAAG